MAITMITEDTPIIMPNIVKKDRNFADIKFLYEILIGLIKSINIIQINQWQEELF